MSEAKFTPGPWYPRYGGEPGHVYSSAAMKLVAVVPHEASDAVPQADTRLIATAPDMLAELSRYLPVIERAEAVRNCGAG